MNTVDYEPQDWSAIARLFEGESEMTPGLVRQAVAIIADLAGDDGSSVRFAAARQAEERLLRAVLRAIADGRADNAAACAFEAIRREGSWLVRWRAGSAIRHP
jgi:ribosome modulation factor